MVVILCNQVDNETLIRQVQNWSEPAMAEAMARPAADNLRTIGLGAQILADVGVRKMRVMSRARKFSALSGFGLEVVDYLS